MPKRNCIEFCGNVCEVLMTGLHSRWLSAGVVRILPLKQATYGPHTIVHEHALKLPQSQKTVQLVNIFPKCWAHVLDDVVRHVYFFVAEWLQFYRWIFTKFLKLVSVLLRVSTYCERWFQSLSDFSVTHLLFVAPSRFVNPRFTWSVISVGSSRLTLFSSFFHMKFQKEPAPFACDVLRFSFASLVLSSTGARLILWIRQLCAQMAFLQQTTSLLGFGFWFWCWPSFLPFLPPLPKVSTSIGSEVLFVVTVWNPNWLRRSSM